MDELSRDHELQLLGLKALAERHRRMQDEIYDAVLAIVLPGKDSQTESGHVSDWIFADSDESPQQLWEHTAKERAA